MALGDLEDIRSFLEREGPQYRELLRLVHESCLDVQREMGSAGIYSVYTRQDKQGTIGDFKTTEKIRIAFSKIRNQKGKSVAVLYDITDIVAVSVVAYYYDSISVIAAKVRHLIKDHARVEKEKQVLEGGYRGYHIVFKSTSSSVMCELQIKTMLHDAWAAKMHDLNYKPLGETDRRLSMMMEAFGNSLQAIEVQSQLIRDLIHERWDAEKQRRDAVRHELLGAGRNSWLTIPLSEKATRLMEQIEETGDLPIGPRRSKAVALLDRRIGTFSGFTARDRFWLSLLLVLTNRTPQQLRRAADSAQALLELSDHSDEKFAQFDELPFIPLAFSVCGFVDRALEAGKFLLENAKIGSKFREIVAFNHANLLVEQACFGPSLSSSEKTSLKKTINVLLQECLSLKKDDPTCFYDLDGMLLVATSDDPGEIRKAIDLIYAGANVSEPGEQAFAKACCELHLRIAWRRLLEVERRLPESSPGRS